MALAVALVACLATLTAGVLSVRQERALQHLKGVLLGMTVQLITGVNKLRVAGAEARAFAVWGTLFRQQQHARQRRQSIADTPAVLNAVLPTVAVGSSGAPYGSSRALRPAASRLAPLWPSYGLRPVSQWCDEPEYDAHRRAGRHHPVERARPIVEATPRCIQARAIPAA